MPLTHEQRERLVADYTRMIADDILIRGFSSIRTNVKSLMQDMQILLENNEKEADRKEAFEKASKHVMETHGEVLKKLGPE